jgi:CheY-like chemotaxis protein
MTRDAKLAGAHLAHANLARDDFAGADLRGADLSHATLKGTNLARADLERADLRSDNLGAACLREARLRRADLRGADLRGADLAGADLTAANLEGARLGGADLAGADLTGVDLTGADPEAARSVAGARLRAVRGLSAAQRLAAEAGHARVEDAPRRPARPSRSAPVPTRPGGGTRAMDDVLVSDARIAPPLAWGPPAGAGAGRRVLVADGDPGVAGLLADLLRDEGYRVRTAADGQAALADIAREPADLVVADVVMPSVDGVTLTARLRQRGDRTPVVLTSAAYADVDLPGVRFVPKPFDLDDMVDVVNRVLAEARTAVGSAAPGTLSGGRDG